MAHTVTPARRAAAGWAWTLLPLLLLFSLLSTSAVSIGFSTTLATEMHTIELGARNDQAAASATATQSTTGLRTVPVDESSFFAGDENGSWDGRQVDLYAESYLSPAGDQTTVQSTDGDHVIAPGTQGSYDFSVRNVGDTTLRYVLDLQSEFKVRGDYVPVLVRFRSGEEWLVGAEDEWVSPQSLLDYEEDGTLQPREGYDYTFEWQWPFEEEDYAALTSGATAPTATQATADAPTAAPAASTDLTAAADDEPTEAAPAGMTATDVRDTQTGNTFSADDLTFNLSINARAEVDELSDDADAQKSRQPTAQTGDATSFALVLVFAGLGLFFLCAALVRMLQRREK